MPCPYLIIPYNPPVTDHYLLDSAALSNALVIVSATSQRALLVTPLRGVTHPTALCAASRCAGQSAEKTG